MQAIQSVFFAAVFSVVWANAARASVPVDARVTAEQQQEVQDAVARLRTQPQKWEALPVAPDVTHYQAVMLSGAVSMVEVAYADFDLRHFFVSIHNPWTQVQSWYGAFSLDSPL